MTWKVKSEKRLHPQYTCVLGYTGDQQIILSKPVLYTIGIGLTGTIADFAVEAIQLQTPLQTWNISSDRNCFQH